VIGEGVMEARIIVMLASFLVAALADFVDPAVAQHMLIRQPEPIMPKSSVLSAMH
jgi:hypothetical protein